MELSPDIRALIEGIQRDIAELRAENAALRQKVGDLERRLGRDSSNSSKPPSSDGLGKKPRIAGNRYRNRNGKGIKNPVDKALNALVADPATVASGLLSW